MRITATIITLNEERNIARAIASLGCADEILVVDSGSADRTCRIAEQMGARVIVEAWRGYAEQKNYAAALSAHDWILSLDADEELTPELAREIVALKVREDRFAGYSFPRRARYLGRWIRHSGWYPDRKIRLYDRRQANWVGSPVHESVRVEGPAGELKGELLHFTCDSLSQHMRTLNSYTDLAAGELRKRGTPAPFHRLVLNPPAAFFRAYFLNLGFLDGFPGLAIAYMAALYAFLKYAKARE